MAILSGTELINSIDVQKLEEDYNSVEETEDFEQQHQLTQIEQSTIRSEQGIINGSRTTRYTNKSTTDIYSNLSKSQKRSKTPIKDVQLADGRGPVSVIF